MTANSADRVSPPARSNWPAAALVAAGFFKIGQRAVPENTRNCGGGLSPASSALGRLWAWCPDSPVVPVPLASIPARCRDAVAPLALGLAWAFSPGAAWAERITFTPDTDPTDNVIGVILIENDRDSGTRTHTLETAYGTIMVQYFTSLDWTPDGQRTYCCPDDVRVADVPEGVLPSAWEIQVDENGTAEITLFLYVGG